MHELLLGKKKAGLSGDYFYNLDFTNDPIGTKTLIDKSGNNFVLPVVGNTDNNFGVVNHPTIGKCFQFNGDAYFIDLTDPFNDFTTGQYVMEVGILKPNQNLQSVFSTGNWTNGYVEAGISITMDQWADPSFQVFVTDAGSFDRHYAPGPNSQQYTEYVIEKLERTKVTNKTTGSSLSYNNYPNGRDTYVSVGGTHGAIRGAQVSPLSGYLKYLRIKRAK